MRRRLPRWIVVLVALPALQCTSPAPPVAQTDEQRPNILIAVMDDASFPFASAYGMKGIETPAFDRLAETGALFTRAFAASPMCSPSRATMLTGRHIWELEEASSHASIFPEAYVTVPELLADAGYAVGATGKGWAPGVWNLRARGGRLTRWKQALGIRSEVGGRRYNPAGPDYSTIELETKPYEGLGDVDYAANFEAFLDEVKPGKPFYFWYGGLEPHRPRERDAWRRAGKHLDSLDLPETVLPDTPATRGAFLDVAVEVEWFDRHLGAMTRALEARGLLENTLVVVTSDQGDDVDPRAKNNLYERGLHVPMAIYWPGHVPGGQVVDALVSLVDLAPTVLEAAGVDAGVEMSGRSLLGLLTPEHAASASWRDYVLAGHERAGHLREDNVGYPSRMIRTDDYLLVWNMKPDRWPLGDPALFARAGLDSASVDLTYRRRPEFELYAVGRDPGNLNDLASDPAYGDVVERLRGMLEAELRAGCDPRLFEFGDVFESYPRFGVMDERLPGFKKRGAYNPAFVRDLDEMPCTPGVAAAEPWGDSLTDPPADRAAAE